MPRARVWRIRKSCPRNLFISQNYRVSEILGWGRASTGIKRLPSLSCSHHNPVEPGCPTCLAACSDSTVRFNSLRHKLKGRLPWQLLFESVLGPVLCDGMTWGPASLMQANPSNSLFQGTARRSCEMELIDAKEHNSHDIPTWCCRVRSQGYSVVKHDAFT